MHIPKTIDNDLRVTDHCPGYGSAAKFVAQAFPERTWTTGLYRVYTSVWSWGVMPGSSQRPLSLHGNIEDDGPHLIYVPEKPFDYEEFVGSVDKVYCRFGRVVMAVSEGIQDAAGIQSWPDWSKGWKETSREYTAFREHWRFGRCPDESRKGEAQDQAGPVRYFRVSAAIVFGCVSEVDAHEAREVGERAVQLRPGTKVTAR